MRFPILIERIQRAPAHQKFWRSFDVPAAFYFAFYLHSSNAFPVILLLSGTVTFGRIHCLKKGGKYLLFPVDCNTHNICWCLQSNIFDATSVFQTNHMVQWNAPREAIFSVSHHDFLVLRDVHSQRAFCLPYIELSAWLLFINWRYLVWSGQIWSPF